MSTTVATVVPTRQILPPPSLTRRTRNQLSSQKTQTVTTPKQTRMGRNNRKRKNATVEISNSLSVDEPPEKKILIVVEEPVAKPPVTFEKNQPSIRRAGEFFLGPEIGSSPVKTITNYLARKDGTDDFYIIRMLTLKESNEKDTVDDIQGKSLLHTEHSLSSLLGHESGIVHQHGMFRCKMDETRVDENGETRTEQVLKLCLVMDCYMPHDFSPKYSNIISMQHYLIKEKRLLEPEAIRIFYKVVEILERLHKQNVVHRDIKLGSIILNKDTEKVTLANFCLGKHLTGDNDLLADQRGSPAYISPDVIKGKPYLGKPSDMWSMGVTLFTMLYGQFPFYDKDPASLFAKIKSGEFTIPSDVNVSKKTVKVIKSLLALDPLKRPTAAKLLSEIKAIIQAEESLMCDSDLQVVPNSHSREEGPRKRVYNNINFIPDVSFLDIERLFEKELESESNESDEWEPYGKTAKRVLLHFPGKIGHITLDELQKFHAIGVARKVTEAASSGLLSITMAPEGVTSHFKFSLNNDFSKSTGVDRVPEI